MKSGQRDTSKWGTQSQNEVVEDYPMESNEQKLIVPYIERMNGNLCVARGEFEDAVKHYNKGLLSLKMLFSMEDDPAIQTEE